MGWCWLNPDNLNALWQALFGGFFTLLSSAAFCFDTQHPQHWYNVCCFNSSYVGYPSTFVSATNKFIKMLDCLKYVFENKNFCIILHKMILHVRKWGVGGGVGGWGGGSWTRLLNTNGMTIPNVQIFSWVVTEKTNALFYL